MSRSDFDLLRQTDAASRIPRNYQEFLIFYRFFLIFRTFLGDSTPDRLNSRSLETLWEWKNRVLLEEYYIFNVAIPLEVE